MMHNVKQIADEALPGNVDTQKFRHQVHYNHKSDSRFESGQDQRGNKVGNKPNTKQ